MSLERSHGFAECSHVTCSGHLIISIGGMIIECKRVRKELCSRPQSPNGTSKDNVWSCRKSSLHIKLNAWDQFETDQTVSG